MLQIQTNAPARLTPVLQSYRTEMDVQLSEVEGLGFLVE